MFVVRYWVQLPFHLLYLLWVVSDYIFGTFKILTRVTINIKKLITRVTSDRVYRRNKMSNIEIGSIGIVIVGLGIGFNFIKDTLWN